MSARRSADETVRDWIRSGPEAASSELLEQALRPIRRTPQRRSWRIAMDRFTGPAMGVTGIAAVLAVVFVAGAILLGPAGFLGLSGGPGASPTPPRASFRLEVTGGPGAGTYLSDPAANLSMCSMAVGGSWRLLYVGGTPEVNLDMLVGAEASQPGGGSSVAVEVEYGSGYVRFDPADLRGGDPAGRSTATVTMTPARGHVTFAIVATTPDRSTGSDGIPVRVDLTVTCPN